MKNQWSQISQNIKALRKTKGITPTDMSDQLSLSLRAYQNIESGQADISFSRLEQIAKILEVNVSHLVSHHEKSVTNNLNQPAHNGVVINHNTGDLSLDQGLKDQMNTLLVAIERLTEKIENRK